MAEVRIPLPQSANQALDKFFAEKTVADIDRNQFLVCNIEDPRFKITISIVFMKEWDSLEIDGYNSIILPEKGCVIIVPCYWISIPKPLAMEYFTTILQEFYNDDLANWSIGQKFLEQQSQSDGGQQSGQQPPAYPQHQNPNCPVISRNI